MRQADAAARELEVDVAFDATPANFAIDQEADVAIVTGEETGSSCPYPRSCATARAGRACWPSPMPCASSASVTTGASDRSRVVVREGLAAGEQVVAPAAGVAPGSRVRCVAGPS